MKLGVIVLSLCLFPLLALGQNATSDSLENLTDQQKFIDVTAQKIEASFFYSTDSLKQYYHERLTRIDSVQRRLKSTIDSVSSHQLPLRKFLSANRMDSLRTGWKSKMDSLTSLDQYSAKISNVTDSLTALQDQTLSELNTKLQSLKDKTIVKLNELELPPKLSDKVSDATSRINGFQIPVSGLNIPNINSGSGLDVGELKNLNIPSVQDLNMDQIGDLKNVQGNLGEVSNITGKVGEYGSDLQGLAKGDLSDLKNIPDATEAKVEELSGLSEIKDQTKALDEYKGLTGKMQNPDSLKEFVIDQAKEIAIDHFAGKEEQLKKAMESVSKYKQKFPTISSLNDLSKKRPNEMRGKPFIERIVPGIAIQLQKKNDDLLTDFNMYLSYRFTGRFTSGAGWNQRIGYNTDRNSWSHENARIYGPRVFSEYKLGKGFSPRAEVEVMNTNVPPLTRTQTTDPFHREWVWGAFAGIKKEYRFFKNIKGTASIMMRLYNPDHKSPYADVVNARFGFEFPMKKKRIGS